MQLETVRFTQNDLAKYPFLKENAAYMKKLGLKIEELANPEMGQILNRAEERVKNAILSVSVGKKRENYVEIPSFPVAIMLAIATKNSFIKKRYALAEAKQAFNDMQSETRERMHLRWTSVGILKRIETLRYPLNSRSISLTT